MFSNAFFSFCGLALLVSRTCGTTLSKITQEQLKKEALKELEASFVDIRGDKEYKPVVSFSNNNLEDVREQDEKGYNDNVDENNEDVDTYENEDIDKKNVDVESMWEGDLISSPGTLESDEAQPLPSKRKVLKKESLWPGGIIPWRFNDAKGKFTRAGSKDLIRDILKEWEDLTCLKFPLFGSLEAKQLGVTHDHVLEFRAGNGCSSYVGFVNKKINPMYLNEEGCLQFGIIMHEIGHVVGFVHEHMRTDRDKYIKVDEGNIKEDYFGNFHISEESRNLTKYDLSSDMHYGSKYFSKNGHDTITVKDPHLKFLIGRRGKLSFYDVKSANKAYKCSKNCSGRKTCDHDGFLDKSCKCYCPDVLSGDRCQSVDKSRTTNCAEKISLDAGDIKDITSPGYPGSYGKSVCIWLLKSTQGTKMTISLKINELPDSIYFGCYHWIEVRYNLLAQTGPRFCGKAKQQEVMVSTDNEILLIFNASVPDKTGRGFHARIHAEIPLDLEGNVSSTALLFSDLVISDQVLVVISQIFHFTSYQIVEIGGDAFRCNFEGNAWGSCPLIQRKDDDFDWRVYKSRTPSANTGPSGGANNTRYYIFTEASRPQKPWDKAVIESQLLEAGISCIQFYYHRFGNEIGSLKVESKLEDGSSKELFLRNNVNGEGTDWHHQQITFASTQKFKIIITGVIGRRYLSDIALDEFQFDRFPCPKPDKKIIEPGYSACFTKPCHHYGECTSLSVEKYECQCQSVFRGKNCEIKDEIIYGIVKCAFDKPNEDIRDFCVFEKSGKTGLSWVRTKGFFTSKDAAKKKIQGVRYFLAVKNIENNEIFKKFAISNTASLTSFPIAAGGRCLTFHYILPENGDELQIQLLVTGNSEELIETKYEVDKKGTNDWSSIKLSIDAKFPYTLRLSIKLSPGSFFALDMLKIETELCSNPDHVLKLDPLGGVDKFLCTFNNGGCGFYSKSDLKWLIRKRNFVFGPIKDHSLTGIPGYFVSPSILFKEAGQKAVLFSPTLKLWGEGCLSFYLYFWGQSIGRLNVYLTSPTTRLSVFSRTNLQYKKWVQARVPVVWVGTFKIEFEFILQNWFGSIAIDDVTLDIKDCHKKS